MAIAAAHQDIYVGRMVNGLTGPTSELLQTHLVLTEMAGRCRSGRTTLWSRPARSSGGSRLSALAATSPNARADVDVAPDTIGGSSATRIRLGDPKTTYQNQHRYVLTYVLPNARLTSNRLQVNIIGSGEEFETGRFDVIISGRVLTGAQWLVGAQGATGGCSLAPDSADYRVTFSPLHKGDGVTIDAMIAAYSMPVLPAAPSLPTYRPDHRRQIALAMVP